MRKITALLPMKANSTRVPGKNFRIFHGRPLYQWVLESLLRVNEIDHVVINTDAKELILSAGILDSNRVIIRDRKSELCGDEVSMNLIIEDDIQAIDSEAYLMTHTTNPMLSIPTIENCLKSYKEGVTKGVCDSLFTVNKYQTRFYTPAGAPINHDPRNLIPTQNLQPWLEENSNLYIFSRNSFFSANARIGAKPIMYVTEKLESVDIDTEDDWNFALVVAKALNRV